MKRFSQTLSLGISLMLLLAVLAGCSSVSSTEPVITTTSSMSVVETTQQTSEPVTIRVSWWGDDTRNKATLDAFSLYMSENKHVTIQGEYSDYASYYQKMVTQLAGGTAPDIMIIVDRWYNDLAGKNNFLKDLGTLESIDFSTVDDDFMKTQLFNGKKVGFPAGLQGNVMTYNKELFAKFNIPADVQFTWDSYLEYGKKVHEQDPDAYLLTTYNGDLDPLLKAYLKQLTGKQFINDDYTMSFTREDLIKVFTFEQALFINNVAEPFEKSIVYGNNTNENPQWLKGNLGMINKFISLIPVYQKASDFDLGVTALPVMPGAQDTGVFTGSTLVYVINENTKQANESAKLLNWMVNNPDAIKVLGTTRGIPATKIGAETLTAAGKIDPLLNEALQLSLKTSSKILPNNAISQDQQLTTIWLNTIDKVAYGTVTPEQAADEMISLFEAKLQELKQG